MKRQTYQSAIPTRVRVLVLGGGIHGVGVLHDLASRGWKDVHLVEKHRLGYGTSSRSTKLIHGGLRYLKRIHDFPLVSEALHERQLLMTLCPDLVKPVELYFPILKQGGMSRWMVKAGLTLYDLLSGKHQEHPHASVSADLLAKNAPILDQSLFKHVYSFWDGQTDDLGLVERVAASAYQLGAGITEGCAVTRVVPSEDGWDVDLLTHDGSIKKISALYVVNALGPWANQILEQSGVRPTHVGINNKGVHLILPDLGLKVGLFLQSPEDDRIFFVLPWMQHTLVGTTENYFEKNPDELQVTDEDVQYLLSKCNRYLREPIRTQDIQSHFAGLRWLAVERGRGLSETSRAYILGEKRSRRGILMTLYGGKLTTYRHLAATIGDRIGKDFGDLIPSKTHLQESWVPAGKSGIRPVLSINERFDFDLSYSGTNRDGVNHVMEAPLTK